MTQLDELLSAAKSLDNQPPPPEAETRMWDKIAAQAGGMVAVGIAATTLGAKTASASTAAASTAAASTAAASTAVASSISLTVAKVGAALALTAGIGIGVAVVASPQQPQTHAVQTSVVKAEPGAKPLPVRRAVKTAAPVVEEVIETPAVIETPEAAAEPRAQRVPQESPRAKTRPRPAAPPKSSLAAESALLGKARVASSSGRNRDALAALRDHARQHPKGELAEVRRALEVRVLCELGRTQAARRAAERFLAKHKASALAGQVRSSCAYQ